MNRTLWEAFTMLYVTGAVSLLAGLLRAAKAASEAAEATQINESNDDGGVKPPSRPFQAI